jgi:hypothetical protein
MYNNKKTVVSIDAMESRNAQLILGAGGTSAEGGQPGYLSLRDNAGKDSIIIDGAEGNLDLFDKDGFRSLAIRGQAFDGKTTGMWVGAAKSDPGPKAG